MRFTRYSKHFLDQVQISALSASMGWLGYSYIASMPAIDECGCAVCAYNQVGSLTLARGVDRDDRDLVHVPSPTYM
jgi:hypothetical protein